MLPRYEVMYWTNDGEVSHLSRFDTLTEALADVQAEFAEQANKLNNTWDIFDDHELVEETIVTGKVDLKTGHLIIQKIWVRNPDKPETLTEEEPYESPN